MLRGRLASASVYLCFVCVLSLPLPQPASNRCYRDTLKRVTYLIKSAPALKSMDCRLYTPTTEDYQHCPRSTLECFADEIKVLDQEWGAVAKRLNLNNNLKRIALHFQETESDCRQCELFREEDAENFLKGLEMTLEMMNSEYCPQITSSS